MNNEELGLDMVWEWASKGSYVQPLYLGQGLEGSISKGKGTEARVWC